MKERKKEGKKEKHQKRKRSAIYTDEKVSLTMNKDKHSNRRKVC